MSFETAGRVPALNGVSDRFEEGLKMGRAESEAQIAALQSQIAILEESNKGYQRTAQTILEVKSERDALREALSGVVDMVTFEFLGGTADESDYSYCHACGSRWRGNEYHLPKCPMFKALALLSVPASGEPAKKP